MNIIPPKVLAFDVFGTVVDWHGSIWREAEALIPGVDGNRFASAWRAGYKPAMDEVRSGQRGWTKIDDLHRIILDRVLKDFDIALDEQKRRTLNRAWHRLNPWPDTVEGMHRLKSRFMLTSLSNGNLGLLANMAKHAALPWDLILSAEVFHHYKPDPETYLGVADIFELQPDQVMLVAAHEDDLDAAKACGLQTAFIRREHEYGPDILMKYGDLTRFTYSANDLHDLAAQLGV
ncbi:MAG: haloacid dehalogenase type II [Burkholderiaceae bacterium]|jgi:2-haloacid dehalogenase